MLAVFNSSVASGPEELRIPGDRSPNYPKKDSSDLLSSFFNAFPQAISLKMDGMGDMAYTHQKQDLLRPRSFTAKDDIFCLFEGTLENLPSLRQQYGLSKSINEGLLVIEAYKTLRDRAPYPASHVVGHLDGQFAFIILDRATASIFVATDSHGKIPFYWGITADGSLAFSDDAELLKGACGKSLASFPQGVKAINFCICSFRNLSVNYSTLDLVESEDRSLRGIFLSGCLFSSALSLRSYEHPKNKVTAVPAMEEELCGTTFKVENESVFAGIL